MAYESYEQACAEHAWDVPERYNIAADVCDKHDPGKLAMVHERYDGEVRELDWGELQALSNQAANVLAGAGVERGDRVAVVLPPTPETAAIFFGTWKLGAMLLSMSVLYGDDGIRHRLSDSEPRVLVTDADNAGRFEASGVEMLILDADLLAGSSSETSRPPTPQPTTPRSSITRRARPAWRRASSTPIATSSPTRSSPTATRSRTESASTAWGSGRGQRASRRSSAPGGSAPSSASISAKVGSTRTSNSTSSAATRSRTCSRRRRRCGP